MDVQKAQETVLSEEVLKTKEYILLIVNQENKIVIDQLANLAGKRSNVINF